MQGRVLPLPNPTLEGCPLERRERRKTTNSQKQSPQAVNKGSKDAEGDRESVTEDSLASLAWEKLRGTKMLSVKKPALFINSKEETKGKKMGESC